MLPILKDGTDALRRAINRYSKGRTWGLDGEGRIALMEAIDLYAHILHMSSPAQMAKATQERMTVLKNMRKAA